MITFRNKGLVDLRAIVTFGVNSKDTKTAIGQFGTGFKYAIAVALRLGATISVSRGLEQYVFTQRRETIRNDEFGLVYMNAQPLGFTTHLGAHWQPWQAFRELYCNMLDEANGEARDRYIEPEEGYTHVYLDGVDFDKVWEERHSIVLPPTLKPLHEDDRLAIYEIPTNALYYRGVRVATLEKPARFTYNILQSLQLTEDRTVTSMWQVRDLISRSIGKISNKAVLRKLLLNNHSYDSFEWGLSFSQYDEVAPEFIDVIHKNRAVEGLLPSALGYYRAKNPQVSLPKKVEKVERQERRDLKEAVALLALLGYDVSAYPVVITDELPDNVLGQVFLTHSDKIYLSRRVFTQGVNMVAGTLLEEFIHLKYGLLDESRQLQNHLLDAVVRAGQRLREAATIAKGLK